MVTGYEAGFYRDVSLIEGHVREIARNTERIADALEALVEWEKNGE